MFTELVEAYNERKQDVMKELKSKYKKYVKHVSTPEMAASLECCAFLAVAQQVIAPYVIIDFGSGFSSYVFRKYKNNSVVLSVDTEKEWLWKSKKFCKNTNVDFKNFCTWDTFYSCTLTSGDLIFIDIDQTKERMKYFEPIFQRNIKKNTLIVVDDYHKYRLRTQLPPLIEEYKFETYELKEAKDGTRFPLLMKKI